MAEQLPPWQERLNECVQFNGYDAPCARLVRENERLRTALDAALRQCVESSTDYYEHWIIMQYVPFPSYRQWAAELRRMEALGYLDGAAGATERALADALEALEGECTTK